MQPSPHRLISALLFLVLSAPLWPMPAAHAQSSLYRSSSYQSTSNPQTVDWYRWYRQLRSYIRANGGLWCGANTPIRFTREGFMTTDSDETECHLSLRRLNFPLPSQAPVNQIILSVPERRRPLSREVLQQRINQQLQEATTPHKGQ